MRTYDFLDETPADPRNTLEAAGVAVQAEPAEPSDDADMEDIYLDLGVGD